MTQLDGLANSIASTSALTTTNNIWGYSVSIQTSDLDLIDSTVQIQVNFLTQDSVGSSPKIRIDLIEAEPVVIPDPVVPDEIPEPVIPSVITLGNPPRELYELHDEESKDINLLPSKVKDNERLYVEAYLDSKDGISIVDCVNDCVANVDPFEFSLELTSTEEIFE